MCDLSPPPGEVREPGGPYLPARRLHRAGRPPAFERVLGGRGSSRLGGSATLSTLISSGWSSGEAFELALQTGRLRPDPCAGPILLSTN